MKSERRDKPKGKEKRTGVEWGKPGIQEEGWMLLSITSTGREVGCQADRSPRVLGRIPTLAFTPDVADSDGRLKKDMPCGETIQGQEKKDGRCSSNLHIQSDPAGNGNSTLGTCLTSKHRSLAFLGQLQSAVACT